MVIMITGASHVGKTILAQQMLEKTKYPYLSIDHLKMLAPGDFRQKVPGDFRHFAPEDFSQF